MKIAALADVKAHLSAYVDECEKRARSLLRATARLPQYYWRLRIMTIWNG